MLLLLLLAHHVLAGEIQGPGSSSQLHKENKEIPKQTNYMFRNIEFCPPEGYFFKKDMGRLNHPGPCYLCFCRENNRAICWPRENKRCDVEHYHHHGVGKRELRAKRSPKGLSDIFFRDNLRELFGKNPPENCKPFESSYSVGCPPSDWCIGCTVCDCDASGRWNCHLLSFCPEKPETKKKNMHRGPKGPYGKKKVYRRNNAIDNNSMVKITSNSANKSKTSKVKNITPVKKRPKNIEISPGKKNVQVKRNSSSQQRPQIKKSMLNKRSSQIVKSPAAKRSQEIKKGPVVQRSQAVNKSIVKKSSPVKKKTNMTGSKKIVKKDALLKKTQTVKIPVKKTPTPKKSFPVKRQLPLVSEKKGSRKGLGDKQQKKRSSTSGDTPKKPMARKLLLTTRPVIINSKKFVQKSNKLHTPERKNVTSVDIHQAIGHEVVKTFMSAIQRAIDKKIPKHHPKHKTKRSIDMNLINDDSYDNDERFKRLDNDFDDMLLRVKRNLGNVTGTTGISNVTYEYNATTPLNNANSTQPTTDVLDFVTFVTEVPMTTQNTSWNTYYKYSVEDIIENRTEPIKIEYGHVNVSENPKNSSVKRSVKEIIDITKAQKSKIVPFKFINYQPSSQLTKLKLTTGYTSPIKLTTKVQIFPFNEANDLKFNKWSEENLKINEQNLMKSLYNSNISTISPSLLNYTGDSKVMRTPKVTRKIGMKQKKYKLKKVINTLLNKTKKYEKISNAHSIKKHKKENSVDNKFSVTNILHGFPRKNVTNSKYKTSKFRIIKYLQKIFKKMFHHNAKKNKKSKHNRTSKIAKLNKDSVLETLCETFGPCYIDLEVKSKLYSKIDDLNAETNRMLVTINTIKGLLRLIDFAKNDKMLQSSDAKHKSNFKDDIHKLTAILKGTYVEKEKLDKLTHTQSTQMEYIKKNTHIFIQSTSKFAKILNEILNIIKRSNANMKNNTRRISRSHENLEDKNRDPNNTLSFEKVKDLLVKYNVLQNQFVKKMYQIVSKLELPPVTEKVTTVKPLEYKDFDKENRTAAIQIYANNIIRNLRKLKYLAQNLSAKNRRKRELRDDDSMEYLLVLMEYLLKQNYPVVNAQVNDGIDLLIDAIKRAPDINTIKKKVLTNDDIRSLNLKTNTTSIENDVTLSNEDSVSSDNILSKESNFTSQQDESKFNLIEESLDESDMDYKYLPNRKSNSIISTTVDPNYKNDFSATEIVIIVDDVTQDNPEAIELSENNVTEPTKEIDTTSDDKELIKNNMIEAASSEEKEGETNNIVKRTFDKGLEDEQMTILTANDIETRSETPITTPVTKAQIVFDVEKIRHYDKDDISGSRSSDKKYLDWLDESIEEEYKNEVNLTESLGKNAVEIKKSVENNSSASNDSSATEKKDDKDDLMYKKEMNLLNSLDYGLLKSESENSESKEILEEKYDSDAIPSYFA